MATNGSKIIMYKRVGDFEYMKFNEKIVGENNEFSYIVALKEK